ncbi:MAG: arsenate reductase family protein [Leptospiraceae bacterium]|nr:arsenate reductase family protein [Leptospiraceae bacterium]
MKLKVYEYKNCGTCKKALKYLDHKKVIYDKIPIRDQPPSEKEILTMIDTFSIDPKKLFNTSGADYRELKIKDKLESMTKKEIIALLASNGNLIKRPFVLSDKIGLVGFKEEEWKSKF